ncbi:hypothetical protein AX16_007291 [Volvariella volvacea WC 439]|nr:hypothetical protein AX16_007291 [Volvariella volvacea WC 439]
MKALTLSFLTLVYATLVASQGLTVNTAQGAVAGTLKYPTVRQWLGIPYARASRWRPPTTPSRRSSTFQATAFGASCPQSIPPKKVQFTVLSGFGGTNLAQSEDCLSLNIWAPSTDRKQNTAVMIWIHGGSFQFGSSNTRVYEGQNFVRDQDDITIVTINYRLNIFGSPGAPQLISPTTASNFGLLDIKAAIQWVQANIANFGGDPNRIVLWGESAGSIAVDAWTYANSNDNTVKGVIEQSGTVSILSAVLFPVFDPTSWNSVAGLVGCTVFPTPLQLACMEQIPMTVLRNAVQNLAATTDLMFNLQPDGITIFGDSIARGNLGLFNKVPLLGGTNQHEGDIFQVAERIVEFGSAPPGTTEAAADLQTTTMFTCPASFTALDRITYGVSTWRYQFQGIFPNLSTRPNLRAYHVAEIPIIFGTYELPFPNIPATDNERALSRLMQNTWATFARDPRNGLTGMGWPKYVPTLRTTALFGNSANQGGVLYEFGTVVDLPCVGISTASLNATTSRFAAAGDY